MWKPRSRNRPKSARRFRTSRVCAYFRSLMSSLSVIWLPSLAVRVTCASRLMNALFDVCSHDTERLKLKRLSPSSAETTRVTSAARAAPAAQQSRARATKGSAPRPGPAIGDRRLPVKGVGATITQPVRKKRNARTPGPEPSALVLGRLGRFAVAQAKLLHLRLQALARDLQLAGGLRDVAAGLVEGALDQLALDALGLGADRLLERARRGGDGRRRRRGRGQVRQRDRRARRLLGSGAGGGRRHRRCRRCRRLQRGQLHQLGWQVVEADLRALAEQDGPLHQVLELADVPWPVVGDQALHRLRLDPGDLLLQALVELGDEV